MPGQIAREGGPNVALRVDEVTHYIQDLQAEGASTQKTSEPPCGVQDTTEIHRAQELWIESTSFFLHE